MYSADCKTFSALTKDEVQEDIAAYKDLSRDEKNQTLFNIVTIPPSSYPEMRRKIAALIYVGADVPTVQTNAAFTPFRLLPRVTHEQDVPLVKLLLSHKARIDESYQDKTAICSAQTELLAQAFVDTGALDYLSRDNWRELLFNIMRHYYEPELITLYKHQQHEFDVMVCKSDNWTLLMELATRPQWNMIKKAKLLMDGLPHAQIHILLTTRTGIYGEWDVFDIIKETYEEACIPEKRAFLDAFKDYLSTVALNIITSAGPSLE